MVIVNTQQNEGLEFKYFLEVPSSNCTFCSGRDRVTGRAKLYLIFSEDGRVYKRNGLRSTWEPVCSALEQEHIRESFEDAVKSRKVPLFRNDSFQSLLN